MREGSREKGSGCGGKEVRCSPSPRLALGEQGPLWGAEGPPGASCAQLELGGSVRAPCGEQARAEDAPNIHAPVSFPQNASTPRHHQIPQGTRCPGWLPPAAPRSGRRREEGDGHPTHPTGHGSSAAFGFTIIPRGPAGRGRRHRLARGGGWQAWEHAPALFGLGNVFLMSHIMFFKLCWNH